ncbi:MULTISPECIES: hypothetical protein [Paenibacillus]|uniref:hypothetical protein n=1 Tax=Paenibacillus TaxID=44249 RepID=UPI0021167615|nr:hypothetical protein [Paenibacillus lautus]
METVKTLMTCSSTPHTALIAVSIPEGWRFTEMYMVIFYAALIAIPKEIEEAATIDGK